MIAPVLILTVAFSVLPLVMVIRRSLYKGNIFDTDLKFSGLANYRDVFRTGGEHALGVTAVYTVAFVVITMVVGFLVALLLDVRLPGLRWVRGLFVIPLVVPAVATALIWFTLFAPDTGLVNRVATGVGLPQATLDSGRTALVAVIAFGAWQFFGEVVLLYLAALKSLPGDVLEAAVIDGASAWQRLRYVRWPLLRNQTALVGVIATLTGLQAFTQIYVLTPDGGPGGSTETALYYVYQQAFGLGAGGSAGRADAMSVVLFLISLAITVAQLAIVARGTRSEAAS
ncbi:carbohydrate ABC transporter permease [Jatrophihabitans endophyticus]|uniref:carbohydrate ABC transporter permease n=1 Tax=Jatrophihabitans endophyticus TaxID=1206085 RepID=UPI0026F1CE01|nr:sugar ABC transporter permease [Jatrophihabitans endophyticus]